MLSTQNPIEMPKNNLRLTAFFEPKMVIFMILPFISSKKSRLYNLQAKNLSVVCMKDIGKLHFSIFRRWQALFCQRLSF